MYLLFLFHQYLLTFRGLKIMGKGDKRSRRGKIQAGSHGKRRPKKSIKKKAKALAALALV